MENVFYFSFVKKRIITKTITTVFFLIVYNIRMLHGKTIQTVWWRQKTGKVVAKREKSLTKLWIDCRFFFALRLFIIIFILVCFSFLLLLFNFFYKTYISQKKCVLHNPQLTLRNTRISEYCVEIWFLNHFMIDCFRNWIFNYMKCARSMRQPLYLLLSAKEPWKRHRKTTILTSSAKTNYFKFYSMH